MTCHSFQTSVTPRLQAEVNAIGDSIKKLFAYRYQVLPFIYTHLVSALCALYLFSSALLKGLHGTADEGPSALLMPLLSLFIVSLASFGLLEVGTTILDPFGDDAEDFALLHFVEYALCMSYEAIQIQPCGARVADRQDFYSNVEVLAAMKLLKRLRMRQRWRKIVDETRAQHGGTLAFLCP